MYRVASTVTAPVPYAGTGPSSRLKVSRRITPAARIVRAGATRRNSGETMAIKVLHGTPKGGKSLCYSCRNAVIVKGINFQELVYCNGVHPTVDIKFPVVECSVFDDKAAVSRYEMEQIAWTVQSRTRGPMGFASGDNMEITIEPPKKEGKYGIPE